MKKPILDGQLVTLRPLDANDAELIYNFSDAEVDRLTGTSATIPLESYRAHYAQVKKAEDRLDYAIVPKGEPDLVGEVVLNNIDWDSRVANFRIVLFQREHFGKGYGSEATKLTVQHGFEQLKLHRIELEVYDFNPRAAHVYEKVGFVKEGLKREVLLWNGEYHNATVMGMLASDYARQRDS